MSLAMPPPASPSPGRVLVGRESELARLEQALAAAIDGRGQIALLGGEAGIGKTCLLDALAAAARQRGAAVLWGTCEESQSSGAYQLFRQALGEYVGHADAAELGAAVGPHASVLARLIPALRERIPELTEPGRLAPDEERARLFDAVSQALFGIAAQRPLVLLLDDVHWADADTVSLLRQFARQVPQQSRLLLVCAYRANEVSEEAPLAETMALVQRLPRAEPMQLRGLAAPELAELLCALADAPAPSGALTAIDPALVEAVREQTGGNPFFARALGRQLLAEGLLVCAAGRWQLTGPLDDLALPDSVRQVLRRQVRRLSPEAQRWLTAGAGIGQHFRFDVAAAVAELDEGQALAVVDEALAAQLIRAEPAPDTYAFAHALVRQALYDLLNPSRQVRLHRRIAVDMERVYGERAIEHDDEIARHYHRSRSLAGSERGTAYALRAADRAEQRHAYNELASLLEIALDLLGHGDARRPRLMARRGLALTWAFAFDAARDLALAAGEAIAEAESPSAAADYLAEVVVAMGNAGAVAAGFDVARRGVQWAGARRDQSWAILMAADIMRREIADPDYPGIPLDTEERRDVGRVFAQAVAGDAWSRHLLDRAAGSTGSRFWSADATSRADLLARGASPAVLAVGRYREGTPVWQAVAETAEREGRLGRAMEAWASASRFHTHLGEFADATAAYRRALALTGRLAGVSTRFAPLLAAADELRMTCGVELEQPSIENSRPASAEPLLSFYRAAFEAGSARTLARAGRADAAMRRLVALIPAIERAPFWADNYVRVCCDAAETLWLLGCSEHAEVMERNLREKAVEPDFRYPMCDGRLALARVCALLQRYDEASSWFARARAVLDEQGARPLRAITDYDEALMYARRGAPGDRERSLPLSDAALAQFRALGMPWWTRCAEHLRETGRQWSATSAAEAVRERVVIPAPSQPRTAARSSFRLEGEFWTIAYGDKTCRLKHSRGLTFLAALLREPGREIAAIDLATRTTGNGGNGAARADAIETRRGLGDAGEMLDAQARASYRSRLGELREELADAEECHDVGRGERLREEIDMLTTELARAVGLGGRERRAGSHAERARVNVTRAIALALAKIDDAHPALAEHLRRTVRTGTRCCYAPDPRVPLEWEVS